MNLNDDVEQFIEEYIEQIEQNNWSIIYIDIDVDITGMFTKIMLDAGIDPLVNMDKIPENFLRHQKIGAFKIPEYIKSIEYAAFYDTDIDTIDIPEGVVQICEDAFEKCNNLTEVNLPHTLKMIREFAFSDCHNLKHVYYNGTIDEFKNQVIYNKNIFFETELDCIECYDGALNVFLE